MSNGHCAPIKHVITLKTKNINYVDVNLHSLCPKLTIYNGGGWLMVKRGNNINKQTPIYKYIIIQ
jgi:hypothetical protein